jgi:hypothetical protein
MFNRTPNDPVPNPPVLNTVAFVESLDRLKLDVDRLMSIHTLNPDGLVTVAEIKASLARN